MSTKEPHHHAEHSHTLTHTHSHSHSHKNTKAIINRLARIEGHVRSIKDMATAQRDCSDLLLQIAAVRKALDSTAKVILKEHLETCVIEAIYHGNQDDVVKNLNKALDHFIR
jgi:CsoR family transcriptional regulator, copper-sensing transcriptional repressor